VSTHQLLLLTRLDCVPFQVYAASPLPTESLSASRENDMRRTNPQRLRLVCGLPIAVRRCVESSNRLRPRGLASTPVLHITGLNSLSSCFLSFVYIDINCLFQSPDSRFRTNRQEFVDLRQFVSFARIGGIGGIGGGLFACVRVYTINMCSVHLYASRHSCICLCCVYMCLSCSTDVIFVERQRELT